jgi:hypothetical protein
VTVRRSRRSAGPTHDPRALALFQNGEMRLVYARYTGRPEDPLFYLPDGKAEEFRQFTKDRLECPVPDCTDRRLTTVARARKRDGFTHYRGAGRHAHETVFHQQGKEAVARWARQRWPEATVVVEHMTRSGERRADVMVTWPDGRQVAIEIQYSSLTVHEWRLRHLSYQGQGITDVWLFGHLPPHLRAVADEPGMIEVAQLQQAMAGTGVVPLWINPVDEKIGTAWIERRVHRCRQVGCDHRGADMTVFAVGRLNTASRAFFTVDDLADCLLTPDGIVTPTGRGLVDSETAYNRAVEAEEQRVAREAAAAQRRAEELRARRDSERTEWEESPLCQELRRRFGSVPAVLSAELAHSGGVLAWPEYWHSVLYWSLICGRPRGSTFTIGDCYRTLDQDYSIELNQQDVAERGKAVVAFVTRLEREGLVEVSRCSGSRWVQRVRIVADLDDAGRAPAELERERAAEVARQCMAKVPAFGLAQWRYRYERKLDYLAGKFAARGWGKKSRSGRPPASVRRDRVQWVQQQLWF